MTRLQSGRGGFAWRRFRTAMRWCTGLALGGAALAVLILWRVYAIDSVHFYVATALAVIGTVMIGGALMGLVFASSGSGHDDAAGGGSGRR